MSTFDSVLWNFPPGTFDSFTILRNWASMAFCTPMQSTDPVLVEISDTGENGLVSTFGSSSIYGAFEVLLNGEALTTYNGRCTNSNVRECGDFCQCSYEVSFPNGQGSNGQCSTECQAETPGEMLQPMIPSILGPEFVCPEGDVPIEIRVNFDPHPGQIAIRITDRDDIRMWDMPLESFGFRLVGRDNIFVLCVAPQQRYNVEIVDSEQDGLVSRQGPFFYYGSFTITYGGEVVTTYNGNCDAGNVSECGAFCSCKYELLANGEGSTGGCTADCTGA